MKFFLKNELNPFSNYLKVCYNYPCARPPFLLILLGFRQLQYITFHKVLHSFYEVQNAMYCSGSPRHFVPRDDAAVGRQLLGGWELKDYKVYIYVGWGRWLPDVFHILYYFNFKSSVSFYTVMVYDIFDFKFWGNLNQIIICS